MAKKFVDEEIMNIVKKYVKKVLENYNVKTIILFGSYAKGTATEDSDIDIAVVTDDIKTDRFDEEVNLMRLRRDIDLRIEPHLIEIDDYDTIYTPFVKEVIDTGIVVV